MENFKGTKGEWKVTEGNFITPLDEEFALCKVFGENNIYITREKEKSNAKLIAAAPELLEALQIAVNILESKNGFSKEFDNDLSVRDMKQAINKALK